MCAGLPGRSFVPRFVNSTEEETMNRAIKRATALFAVIAAFAVVAAPAASARFDLNPPSPSDTSQAQAPTSSVRDVSSSSSGFSWGDAAVGAGVALAVVALAGGAVLIARRGDSRPVTTS
jgi:Na+/proline symporter